jgi:hypothetical protein
MLISLTACSQAAPISLTDTASPVQTHITASPVSSPKQTTESLPSPTVAPTAQPAATATIENIPTDTPRLPSRTPNPTAIETIEVFPTEAPWPTDTPIPGLETGASITLTALTMFDETTGWGVESTGHIMRTTDGGSSWQDVTPPQGQLYPEGSFYALDAGTAWAAPWLCSNFCYPPPTATIVWRTSDGGQSWRSWKSTGNESFFNADIGWRLYSPDPAQLSQLQTTTDGGLDWVNIKEVAWQSARFEFVSEQVGWAIVSIGEVTALLHTNDGGKTWVELKQKR